MPFSLGSSHKKQGSSGSSSRKTDKGKNKQTEEGEEYVQVHMTLYIFRGEPDMYFNRHVLLYFTSDNPNFHETIHVQRDDKDSPWGIDQDNKKRDWALTRTYISHLYVGSVMVKRGQEKSVVDIFESIPVAGKEEQSDWNCQHFVLEGMASLVNYGYQTTEWYNYVERTAFESSARRDCRLTTVNLVIRPWRPGTGDGVNGVEGPRGPRRLDLVKEAALRPALWVRN